MIKSVWPFKLTPSFGQRQDIHVTANEELPINNTKVRVRGFGGVKSKWKINRKTKFSKSSQYLGRRCKNSLDTIGVSGESSNLQQLSVPKTDKNWIRIQVNNNDQCGSNSAISEVIVDYNPEGNETAYNENPVDVPGDILSNYRIESRTSSHWNKNQKLRQTIQEFLREDWISGELSDSKPIQEDLTDCDSSSCRNDDDSITQSNVELRFQRDNCQRMGVNCSTKLGKFRKHLVGPTDNGIIICEQKLATDKSEQTAGKIDSSVKDKTSRKSRACFQTITREIQTYPPDLFAEDNNAFHCAPSGTIEWDNILHRRNDIEYNKSNFVSTKSNLRMPSSQSTHLRVPKPAVSTTSLTLPQEINILEQRQYSSGRLLRRFSGSVQNLVSYFKSASESNLTKLQDEHLRTSGNFSSNTEIDYCPSVLYNRKQIAESKAAAKSSERGVNLRNLKKFFSVNFPNMKRPRDRRDS